MHYITDAMFWVSNGLLIPVIVGLLVLFVLAILMLGSFFGVSQQFRKRQKKYEPLIRVIKHKGLEPVHEVLERSKDNSPFESTAVQLFDMNLSERHFLIADYEQRQDKRLSTAKMLTKFGPILGLMGTLIPMGPALVGLSSGDIATMAYNMQVAFATTVLGMFISGVGYLVLQIMRSYHRKELIWLDYINDTLTDEKK